MLKSKDLLGLEGVSKDEITQILDTAAQMKKILMSGSKKTPHLQGKSVILCFFENSTRTRVSFDLCLKISFGFIISDICIGFVGV